jgi:V/A-type H+-transporting ATPase subunit I
MFLPLEMQKAIIGVHESYQDLIIATLHEAGIMQIINIWDSESDISATLQEAERPSDIDRCTEELRKVAAILDVLHGSHDDTPRTIREVLFPRPALKIPVRKKEFSEICREREAVTSGADDALAIQRELESLQARISRREITRETAGYLSPLDIDFGHLGESAYLFTIPVSAPLDGWDAVKAALRGAIREELMIAQAETGDQCTAVITTLRENRDAVQKILRDQRIPTLDYDPMSGRPADVIAELDAEIRALREHESALVERLREIEDRFATPLLTLHEELGIEKVRMLSRLNFGRTNHTVVIEGWVAKKEARACEKLCLGVTDGHAFCSFADPGDDEDVPIVYDNPAWLRPFELITTMFARPNYDEIDPTFFTAPLLIIFFALMLGDAVYGLLIVLLGIVLKNGLGRVSPSVRDMSIILMVSGAATVVSGILQGGYMGDLLPRFFGIQPPFVLINALKSPIEFLQIALVIGVLQINLGLILAAYQNLRRKRLRLLAHEQVSWFLIQPGAAVMIFEFFGWGVPGDLVRIPAYAVAVIGIALVLYDKGLLGLFDFTGFLGDWLSYARLLALALATGGIAMTVNILTQMVSGDHPVLMIAAVMVFVIGQTFNFVLQTLGAFIHSLRLQFVEFFGKFYSGGGKEFTPFSVHRDITELQRGE